MGARRGGTGRGDAPSVEPQSRFTPRWPWRAGPLDRAIDICTHAVRVSHQAALRAAVLRDFVSEMPIEPSRRLDQMQHVAHDEQRLRP